MNFVDFERILLEHRIRASIELLNKGLDGEAFSLLGAAIELRLTWGNFAGKTRKGIKWYVGEPRAIREFRKGFDVAPEYVIKHIVQAVNDMLEEKPVTADRFNWDYI